MTHLDKVYHNSLCPHSAPSCCHWLCSPPYSLSSLKRWSFCSVLLFVFGAGLLITALILPNVLETAVYDGLHQATVLNSPLAQGYDKFVSNSNNPLYISVYVYDLINSQEFLNDNSTGINKTIPHFIERGPYVYADYRNNFDISWPPPSSTNLVQGDIIQYKQWQYFKFVPEKSIESNDNRIITTFNFPIIGAIKSKLAFLLAFLNYKPVSEYDLLFTNRTIHDILFGYTNNWAWPIPGLLNNYSFSEAQTKVPIFNQHTGYADIGKIRRYATIGGSSTTGFWKTEKNQNADSVQGSDGSQFGPVPISLNNNDIEKYIRMYFNNYKRVIGLEYNGDTSYKSIDLYRFRFPKYFYKNSTEYSDNSDYYQDGPTGLINLTQTASLTPLYASEPHFRYVHPSIASSFNIDYCLLGPPETFFDIEPYSGASFHFITSSQVNVYIESEFINGNNPIGPQWFKNIPSNYYPIFWAAEEGSISDADAKEFKDGVYGALLLRDIVIYLGYIIGILLLLLSLFTGFVVFRHYKRFTRLLTEHTKLLDESKKLRNSVITVIPTGSEERFIYNNNNNNNPNDSENSVIISSDSMIAQGTDHESVDISAYQSPKHKKISTYNNESNDV